MKKKTHTHTQPKKNHNNTPHCIAKLKMLKNNSNANVSGTQAIVQHTQNNAKTRHFFISFLSLSGYDSGYIFGPLYVCMPYLEAFPFSLCILHSIQSIRLEACRIVGYAYAMLCCAVMCRAEVLFNKWIKRRRRRRRRCCWCRRRLIQLFPILHNVLCTL